MQKHIYKMTLLALAAILLLTACGPSEEDLKATAAAQTLEVIAIKETTMFDTLQKLTQTEAAKPPTETPTPTPTETPVPSATLSGLSTPTNPLPGGGAGGGDQYTYVSDNIPDGTRMTPGQSFTMTWKLSNTGTTTWSTSYALVFVSGNQMSAKSENYLSVSVAPGTVVDISVPMTAPAVTGPYQGYWQMRNANGKNFGGTIWVKIDVGAPLSDTTTPTVTGTIFTPTPSSTPTVDPLFKVTAISIDAGGAQTNPTNINCNVTPFVLTVGATITAEKAGTVKYIWGFDGAEQGEQTITFTGSSSQSVFATSGAYTATNGMGITITLRTTAPNAVTDTKTKTISCN